MNVKENIMNSQTNRPIMSLAFDSITGAYLLTADKTKMNKSVFYQLLMSIQRPFNVKKLEEKVQQLETQILENHVNKEKEQLLTEMKKIGIEKLPYSYSALKPFIDPETMDFHYNKQ